MYFPILRGKQFELLALREFSSELKAWANISPIIEPVKSTIKALETACEYLSNSKANFTIIANPIVGEVSAKDLIPDIANIDCLNKNNNYQIGINCSSEDSVRKILKLLERHELSNKKIVLIHHVALDKTFCDELHADYNIKYNLIHNNKIRNRRYKNFFDAETRIDLEDVFLSKEKNVDYLQQVDELFTQAHIYFEEDGYAGFSDYVTIGDQYTDGGFRPYAVVIHLTYQDKNDESIRIRHFVSDSNEDFHDTPGKFSEALEKLVQFTSSLTNKTNAIKTFEEYYSDERYPGLGTIKKLSILNHLELIKHILS